jgi:hypothetical protein
MLTVVDDATLLAILTRRASAALSAAASAGDVLTTGSWYYRLAPVLARRLTTLSQGGNTGSNPVGAARSLANQPGKVAMFLRLSWWYIEAGNLAL